MNINFSLYWCFLLSQKDNKPLQNVLTWWDVHFFSLCSHFLQKQENKNENKNLYNWALSELFLLIFISSWSVHTFVQNVSNNPNLYNLDFIFNFTYIKLIRPISSEDIIKTHLHVGSSWCPTFCSLFCSSDWETAENWNLTC